MKLKIVNLLLLSGLVPILCACNSGGGNSSSGTKSYTPLIPPTGSNYLTVYVSPNQGGSVCSNYNQPCVSLTICSLGNANECTTINNMLLDSGSSGIRVFKSLVSLLQLTQLTADGDKAVAQCINYTNSKATWGPVQSAKVVLNGENGISSLPIQVIDNTFAIPPSQCANAASNPAAFGYNGVVGISPLLADRGDYYACESDGNCSITALSNEHQVANPIRRLSSDNNGVVLQFPAIGANGASNVTGYAIFGIGTESNNQPESTVTTYAIPSGVIPPYILMNYNGTEMQAVLDTGTNTFIFPDSDFPVCSAYNYFCPLAPVSIFASVSSVTGSPTGTVNFNLGNALELFSSQNTAYNNLGSLNSGGSFIYGMPFFYGRTIYIGFAGESSSLGDGPYWAF